jgi:hypothetical protein
MFSTKARNIILALISLCAAALIAIAVETTKGVLFEIRKSIADLESSKAAHKAAEADSKAAEAQTLDAINRLKGTLETAAVMNNVGQLQAKAITDAAIYAAKAQRDAAQLNKEAVIVSTDIVSHPENAMYDSVTGPLFGDPASKISKLNDKIVRLKRESTRGIDARTLRTLSPEEIASRAAEAEALEEELVVIKEASSKNFNDTLSMFLGGTDGLMGMFGKPVEKPAPRRIIEEK